MTVTEHDPNDDAMHLVASYLEAPPAVRVPEDFAARVLAALPSQSRLERVAPQTAKGAAGMRSLMLITAALLVLGFVLAPLAAHGDPFWQTAEYIACAQTFAFALLLFLLHRTAMR